MRWALAESLVMGRGWRSSGWMSDCGCECDCDCANMVVWVQTRPDGRCQEEGKWQKRSRYQQRHEQLDEE
jgi:hypothetical protein